MKVTKEMIDKDLRLVGTFFKIFFRPNLKSLTFMHKVLSLNKGKNIRDFNCSEIFIPSRDSERKIRVRTYKPKNISKKDIPGVLLLHGGGYLMNIPESEHFLIKTLLNTKDCVIIAPDYRLSTVAPFPAAINDCYDSLEWMVKNAKSLHFNPNQVFIIGVSAGGGLTAALTIMARDEGRIRIAYQMPLYPMIDHRMQTKSMIDNNAPVWSEKHNKLAWDLYLKNVEEKNITSYASPALNSDFTNLPSATTFVGDIDPFRDEVLDYFKNLETAGVKVNYRIFKGAYHGFEIVARRAKISREALDYIKENFRYAVDHYFAEQFLE